MNAITKEGILSQLIGNPNDTGNTVFGKINTIQSNINNLPAAEIKTKTFQGTTPATHSTTDQIAHGLDYTKIYHINCIVFKDDTTLITNELALYPPNYYVFAIVGDYMYLSVDTEETSGEILNKPYNIIIFYKD